MITAVVYEKTAELRIVADTYREFEVDLMVLKKDIDSNDRQYIEHKKVWQVKHLEKYIKVPYIRSALLDREKQLTLF